MATPEYNRPYPDEYSFGDLEPDWFDDLEVTKWKEEGGMDDTDHCVQ
jgi:hypothetical protein